MKYAKVLYTQILAHINIEGCYEHKNNPDPSNLKIERTVLNVDK